MSNDPEISGAYVKEGHHYSNVEEQDIKDMASAMVRVGSGKRADLVAQAALDATLAIWGWCGVTQEQAVQVLTAQAAARLPRQN